MKNIVLLSILMLFSLALFSKEVVANPYEQSAFVIDNIEVWITRPSYKSNNCNIFILVHSMVFAYSLGTVSYHRDKIEPDQNRSRFVRYYIIELENTCSAEEFTPNIFDQVWQYGTAEPSSANTNPNRLVENDGVAPQCGVKGLNWDNPDYARIGFPENSNKLNFFDAHSIISYDWIFKIILNRNGYVKSRK